MFAYQKKKILFLVTQSELGGAQRAIFDLAKGLFSVSKKQSFKVVAAAGPEGDNQNGLLVQLAKTGIKTIHLKYLKRNINPYYDLRAFFEIRKLIRQEKPDLLQLGSSKAGFLGSLAARNFKDSLKVIYRIGGWAFNEPTGWLKRKIYFWAEKWSVKYKDVIVVNSDFERQQAINLKICPAQKIVTVYNGIALKQMKFLSKEEARAALGFSQKESLVGTIANFYPSKGLEYLVDAAHLLKTKYRMPNTKYIVIGDGREREKLEKLIKEYNLEDCFFLPGQIPEAYQYLKAFDVFVLSSIKEGMPWTILEAMAAQLPIVATNVGGVPEMLSLGKRLSQITKGRTSRPRPRQRRGRGISMHALLMSERTTLKFEASDRVGLLIPLKNSQQLAEKITYILRNPQIAQDLAQKAKEKVIKDFALEKMLRKMKKIYLSI